MWDNARFVLILLVVVAHMVSTVRTQISSVRAKTGAASIRALVKQVAQLPPMVGALRRCND